MSLMLGEHGEAILYGVVGIMLVCLICLVCNSKWKNISPSYKTEHSPSNREFANGAQNKYPVIESDDVIYADYSDHKQQPENFTLKDCCGKILSIDAKVKKEMSNSF